MDLKPFKPRLRLPIPYSNCGRGRGKKLGGRGNLKEIVRPLRVRGRWCGEKIEWEARFLHGLGHTRDQYDSGKGFKHILTLYKSFVWGKYKDVGVVVPFLEVLV